MFSTTFVLYVVIYKVTYVYNKIRNRCTCILALKQELRDRLHRNVSQPFNDIDLFKD